MAAMELPRVGDRMVETAKLAVMFTPMMVPKSLGPMTSDMNASVVARRP